MYIEKIIQYMTSADGFAENWLNSYDFSDAHIDSSYKSVLGKVNYSIKLIFENLNYSLISGEFVRNEEYTQQLDRLKNLITSIQSEFELTEDRIQDKIGESIHKMLTKPLNKSISELTMMAKRFERNLAINGYGEIILDAFTIKHLHRDVPVDDNLKLLLLNIKLTELDRNLSVDKTQLAELILIKQEIISETGQLDKITSILRDKCNYLIRKILYRLEQDEQTSYLYAFDYQAKQLTIDNVPAGCFENFDQITKKHYSIDGANFRSNQIEQINEKIRLSNRLSCLEFHHLTKYYKDNNKNDIQVSELFKDFNNQYKDEFSSREITLFDIKAHRIIRNYLINNKFSIFKENHPNDIDKVEYELSNVIRVQQETDIHNYFPLLQFANYLVNRIQFIFDKKGNIENQTELVNYIEKLRKTVKLAFKNFEWSKSKNLKAFQLPFRECIIESQELDVNLFLSSSFVLPINYEKVKIELEELNKKLAKYIMLYDMHQTMEHDKQKIIVLANNVEKAERNSIQILGIFSAVIMFSASSVQIFSMTGITIDYAIKFMLAFGYCLVLFISLIWLISRDDHSRISLRYRVFFVVLLTATLMSLIYISNGDNNHKSNTENESILPKIRKDTINKIFQSPRPRLKHSPMT